MATPDAALNPEALNEIEHAINKLQEMKRNLEESPDFVAAKAEKEKKTRESQAAALRETIEGHKREAERLLGYPPFEEASRYCNAYHLLPKGHVDKSQMLSQINCWQAEIKKHKAQKTKLLEADEASFSRMGPNHREVLLNQHDQQIKDKKYMLLSYLMQNTPIDAAAFHAKLAPHIEGLLEAFQELRNLEMA
jgi:rubrerythrin